MITSRTRPVEEPLQRRTSANRTQAFRRRDRPLAVPLSDTLRPAIMRRSIWADTEWFVAAGPRVAALALCAPPSDVSVRAFAGSSAG